MCLWSFLGQTFRVYCQQESDRDWPKQSKSHCWNATSQESQGAKRINRATVIHKKIYISTLSKMSTLLWTPKRRSSLWLEWQVSTGLWWTQKIPFLSSCFEATNTRKTSHPLRIDNRRFCRDNFDTTQQGRKRKGHVLSLQIIQWSKKEVHGHGKDLCESGMGSLEVQALLSRSRGTTHSKDGFDQILARKTCADGMPSQMAKLP